MTSRFVTVLVEEHEALPDGCCMRFKLVDEPRPVRRIRHEADGMPEQIFDVEAQNADGSSGPAMAVTVEDSGAGVSVLVYGGDHGLRLRSGAGASGDAIAEAYLLLSSEAVIE